MSIPVEELHNYIPQDIDTVQLAHRWDQLYGARSYLHHRWEDYAGWTLPYVYPIEEYTSTTEMQIDYQSTGAQAVNNLSNRIVSTLFVPNRPFFRIDLPEDQVAEAVALGLQEADLEQVTSQTEAAAMKQMERVGLRTALLQAVKSLIVTGNSLMFFPPNAEKAQVYSLRDYCISRDMSGNMVELITRDCRTFASLPMELQDLCRQHGITDPDAKVTIYTGVQRIHEDRFIVKQEIDNMFVIPRDKGIYSKRTLPWIPISWNLVRGYDYGTGLVEDYAGAFSSLSSYMLSYRDLAAIVSDIKGLVNPMGSTDLDSLNNSEAGTFVYGNPDDIAYLNLEKAQDLQFLQGAIEMTKREIAAAFLLEHEMTRDAERVTAEEIRRQAHSLEESLGGVYSRLAEELQQPLAFKLLDSLDSKLKTLDVQVLTGVEALSRTSDLDNIMMMFNDIALLQNLPEQAMQELDFQSVIKILGAHRHVDYEPMLKTPEQKQAEQEAAMAQQERMMQAEAQAKAAPQQ